MQTTTIQPRPLVEWGSASRARPGESLCADRALVRPFAHGFLAAVLDGTGAVEEAAVATGLAADILNRYRKEPVIALAERCHRKLMPTHGIALAMASIHAPRRRLCWLGLGNVHGQLWHAACQSPGSSRRECLRPYPAVAGYHLPPVHESTVELGNGDILVLASDGVESHFERHIDFDSAPEPLAHQILERGFTGTDDAAVLVLRYLGVESPFNPAETGAQAELKHEQSSPGPSLSAHRLAEP